MEIVLIVKEYHPDQERALEKLDANRDIPSPFAVEQEPERNPTPPSSQLPRMLWGLDWSEHLPMEIANSGIRVELSRAAAAFAFLQENEQELAKEAGDESSDFLSRKPSLSKQVFYVNFVDAFLFKETSSQKPVGIALCHALDWNSYYLRYVFLLERYRGKGLYGEFLKRLFEILKAHSVARFDVHVSPSNLPHIGILSKLQLNQTGMVLSECWGTLLQFSKFLEPGHEKTYLSQFCLGRARQLEPRQRSS